jgi:hypothetical protein
MTTENKNKVVYCNLYVDLVYPDSMTPEQAQAELTHKLKSFAVLNQDLTIKLIGNPMTPDKDTIYLP